MKKVKVVVNGTEYSVELGDLDQSPVSVKVNDKEYSVEYKVEGGAAPAVGKVAAHAPAPAPSAAAPAPVAAAGDIIAPLPGNILDVKVKPGDSVEARQLLCYLEAMKMKNEIRSPRAGVIASIEVQEGQTVEYGHVLFRFE